MAIFDYSTEAELSPTASEVALIWAGRRRTRQPTGYGRFARATEAGRVIPIDLKVGDRVLFGKWSGTEVKIDNAELLIMMESDIMGVVIEAVTKKMAA